MPMTRVEGPVWVVPHNVLEVGILHFPDGGWRWRNLGDSESKGSFDPNECAQFAARYSKDQWFDNVLHARLAARRLLYQRQAALQQEIRRLEKFSRDGVPEVNGEHLHPAVV